MVAGMENWEYMEIYILYTQIVVFDVYFLRGKLEFL